MPAQAGKVDQLRNPNSVSWKQYELYTRDHWQIGGRTTLTYGLRWELFGVPRKDHTGINLFDPDTGTVFTGGLSGVPFDSGARSETGQFLPRVGERSAGTIRRCFVAATVNLLNRDVSGCKERFPDRQHLVHARH